MSRYDHCSREELLRVITELEEENNRLKAAADQGAEPPHERGGGKPVPGRFRERYAQKIFDALPDMLTVLTPEGELVDLISSEQTNHVGEPGSQLIGRHISTMLSPEAYQSIKANLDSVVASGQGSTSHHDITLDGITNHYENRIYPLDGDYSLCMCRDVTEEQNIKENLVQANRRMEKAEEIASLSHWYYYADSEEFEDNTLIPKLMGFKSRGAANNRCELPAFLAYVHTADRAKIREQLDRADCADDYVEFRLFVNGSLHYLHSRVIYVYHENGKRIVEGYTQDMTHIVERLHELEVMNYALDNVDKEIFACDLEGRIVFTNKQFRSHNRISGELVEKRVYELETLNGNRQQWEERVKRIRGNTTIQKHIAQIKETDGKITTMEFVSYPIYDDFREREIIWFFGRDISLQITHEAKIKQMNSLMETILNNISVCLFVKDPGNEFRYLYWNKAFEEYSGIPASKALGSTDYELFPDPKDAEKFRRDDLNLLRIGQRIEFEEQYTAATGARRIVTTSKALVPAENRLPLIIGLSWDVTEMKKTQLELIEARAKAEASDRLKSAFLANMSHEIRTPLNAIVGFSKLLAEVETEQEKQQFAEIIDSNSELLLQLINDILDISKIEAGTLEFNYKPVNLNELCRAQQEIHKSRVKEGVELVFDEKYDSVFLTADQNRLSQVFTNLITNAIKFTSSGQILFGFNVREEQIDFYVSDTGIGIPKEKQASIFDRFVKLNDFAAGTGLGLAISRMIIEKMEGTIRVESEQGAGTIFRFSIPYVQPAEEEETEASAAIPSPEDGQPDDGRVRTILAAEDIDSNYLLIEAFIGKKFNLLRAHNGEEAVQMWHDAQPDAVLMDLKMPRMDGFEATRQIRAVSKSVPIIAMSAFAFGDDRDKAAAAGCNDFITKPLSQSVLLKTLNRFLNRKRSSD